MNAHYGTPEYAEGYKAGEDAKCPYKAGSTKHMLWKEGWNDARDDEARKHGMCEQCHSPFVASDLEDGVTIPATCCEVTGLCRHCATFGNHGCRRTG